MSQYRNRNQTVLVKIETTPGVDATPAVGSDAVLCEAPEVTRNLQNIETDEVTPALERRLPIPAGGEGAFNTRVWLHGPGATANPPECGRLLRACGLSETTVAADVTAAAVTGAPGSITLAAGSSSVNEFHTGRVISLTGGTGAGQSRVITAYNGTTRVASVHPNWAPTPDATSQYAIRAGTVYQQQSALLPTATVYRYRHRGDGGNSKLDKVLGCVGNARLMLQVRGGCYWDLQFRGNLSAPADVAKPGAPTYQTPRPFPFLDATTHLNGTSIKLTSLEYDVGNQIIAEPDPNSEFGYDVCSIVDRQTGGTIIAPKELESTRNAFNSWRNSTGNLFSTIFGSAVGNRYAVLARNLVYQNQADQDQQGMAYDSLPFRLNPECHSGLLRALLVRWHVAGILVNPRELDRFQPWPDGPVFFLRVPQVRDRHEFRRAVRVEGGRYWPQRDLIAACKKGVMVLLPDDSDARQRDNLLAMLDLWLEQIETALADWREEKTDENWRAYEQVTDMPPDIYELWMEVEKAYLPLRERAADNLNFGPISGYVAARMFLDGWEGVEAEFHRPKLGPVPDSVLDHLRSDELIEIGRRISELLEPNEARLKNFKSPSIGPLDRTPLPVVSTPPESIH